MLRGWRSVRRVLCVYPVLFVVCLISPSIFLTPSISASAPSNTGFFPPKSARVGIRMNAMRTRCTYSGRFSLCLPSLPLHVSLYIPPVLLLPHGVSSIGSSFQYSPGLVATLPYFVFATAVAFASFPFFFSFGGVLASGDARVLEPLRDTSVISKLGLGHSLPARRGGFWEGWGNRVFSNFFFCC